MQRMVAHLTDGGTLILLEAAPNRAVENCDSSIFRARQRSAYLRLFADCGLRVRAITGVDPAPFKTWLVPYLPRLPPWVALQRSQSSLPCRSRSTCYSVAERSSIRGTRSSFWSAREARYEC